MLAKKNNMEGEFNKDEERWVRRLKRCMEDCPSNLKLYSTDAGSICVCKDGVGGDELNESIHCPIDFGAVLTDMHHI